MSNQYSFKGRDLITVQRIIAFSFLLTIILTPVGDTIAANVIYWAFLIGITLWFKFEFYYPLSELLGINAIVDKLSFGHQQNKHASYFIWMIAVYTALFGMSSQRYENSLDRLQVWTATAENYIAGKEYANAVSSMKEIANSNCPTAPSYLLPLKTLHAFFMSGSTNEEHQNTINKITQRILNSNSSALRKENLANLSFQGLYIPKEVIERKPVTYRFSDTTITGTDFSNAELWYCNFDNAYFNDETDFSNTIIVYLRWKISSEIKAEDRKSEAKRIAKVLNRATAVFTRSDWLDSETIAELDNFTDSNNDKLKNFIETHSLRK